MKLKGKGAPRASAWVQREFAAGRVTRWVFHAQMFRVIARNYGQSFLAQHGMPFMPSTKDL